MAKTPDPSPHPLERCGAASLTAILGLGVGALLALAARVVGIATSGPLVVMGTVALFALFGAALPRVSMSLAEAVVHALFGAATLGRGSRPDRLAPRWLRIAFWVGAIGAGLLCRWLWH